MQKIEIGYWITSTLILCLSLYFIYLAPIKAVKVARELEDKKNKYENKKDLFLTLFALRGEPLHKDYVEALNTIVVIFEDVPSVLTAWNNFYFAVNQKGLINQEDTWNNLRNAILSEMAISLNYHSLKSLDISQVYSPQGHQVQLDSQQLMHNSALKYFSSGSRLHEILISDRQAENSSEGTE